MADEGGASNAGQGSGTPGSGSQAGQEGQGSGSPQQGSGTSAQQQSQQQQQTESRIAELTKQIEDLRKESAAHRTKAKEAEDSKLSETEKLQKQIAELTEKVSSAETERRQRTVADQVSAAGKKAGALYPDTLHKILDLELGDDGMPKNLDSAIAKARKDYPAMFGAAGSADGGTGRGQAPKTGWLRDAVSRRQ